MQHIFNIAIDMDDRRIVDAVSEKAEEEILKKLLGDVESVIFDHRGWKSSETDPKMRDGLSRLVTEKFEEFLNENRDEIFDRAGKHLADKLSRTKAAKDLLRETFANG